MYDFFQFLGRFSVNSRREGVDHFQGGEHIMIHDLKRISPEVIWKKSDSPTYTHTHNEDVCIYLRTTNPVW